MSRPEAPDTLHSAIVQDHHFVEKEGEPWERCQAEVLDSPRPGYATYRKCGLSRAAHAFGPIEDTDPGRPPSMRDPDSEPERPSYIQGKCMLPLDDDDSAGGDGMIFCWMDEGHGEDHGGDTISAEALQELARKEAGDRTTSEQVKVVGYNEPDDYVPGAGTSEDARKTVTEHVNPPGERGAIMEVEGHKDDSGKAPFFYLPWQALEEVAFVMEFGAQKYAAGNYRKGMSAGRLMSACIRHWVDWWKGEDLDPESGRSHLAHATCCVLMCLETFHIGTSRDDRYAYIDTK